MRGEHIIVRIRSDKLRRFIPACAGNTLNFPLNSSIERGSSPHARGTPYLIPNRRAINAVHPRMRGEHVAAMEISNNPTRFIPACAENTSPEFITSTAQFGSSPHARGTLTQSGAKSSNSSVHPRMRGEHTTMQPILCVLLAFIPACAGNTLFSSGVTVTLSVHPRMRGEH